MFSRRADNFHSLLIAVVKVQEKYDDKFHRDLQSCIKREDFLRHTLGLEARDDCDESIVRDTHAPKMTFENADITKGIDHQDESFDLIICKKTLDVILCGAGSVIDARAAITECFRLLNKDHGVMIILSSARPEDRAVYFENDPWSGVINIKLPGKVDDITSQKKGNER